MIDFLLGLAIGAALMFAFKGQSPAKQSQELAFLSTLETKVRLLMSQAGDEIVAKLQSVEAAIDAKIAAAADPVKAQLAAEQADHQADLTNIGNVADQLAQKVA